MIVINVHFCKTLFLLISLDPSDALRGGYIYYLTLQFRKLEVPNQGD